MMDYTDPTSPTYLGKEDTYVTANYVEANQDRLLVTNDHAGFSIYDISDPDNPAFQSRELCLNNPLDVYFKNKHAYFTESKDLYEAATTLFLSETIYTEVIDEDLFDDDISCMTGYDYFFAVGTANDGIIAVYDIAGTINQSNPMLSWTDAFGAYIHSIAMTPNRMYVSIDGNILKTFATNFPTCTEHLDVATLSTMKNLTVHGDVLYGTYKGYVMIFDCSNTLAPVEITSFGPVSYLITGMVVRDDYMYLCTKSNLTILDISDPMLPVLVSEFPLPYAPNMIDIEVDEIYAYLSDDAHNPYVVDISNPASPQNFVASFGPEPSFPVTGIAIHQGRLYQMQEVIGVRIYDLY